MFWAVAAYSTEGFKTHIVPFIIDAENRYEAEGKAAAFARVLFPGKTTHAVVNDAYINSEKDVASILGRLTWQQTNNPLVSEARTP